jgi:hypothetical protein
MEGYLAVQEGGSPGAHQMRANFEQTGLLILLCGSIEQLVLHLVLEHLANLGPR